MKKILIFLFTFVFITTAFTREKWAYVCSYCTATVTQTVGVVTTTKCDSWVYELRMTEYPLDNKPGVNSTAFPSGCKSLNSAYNGNGNRGDGVQPYTDSYGIPWIYVAAGGTGTITDPFINISYSNTTEEFCIEIPILECKYVIFKNDENFNTDGYTKSLRISGTQLIMELRQESLPGEPLNPVEKTWTYETKALFEDESSTFFTLSPNPFTNSLTVNITQENFDNKTGLSVIIKNYNGTSLVEQNISSITTVLNTTEMGSGNYIIFIYKNGEIIDYRYIIK